LDAGVTGNFLVTQLRTSVNFSSIETYQREPTFNTFHKELFSVNISCSRQTQWSMSAQYCVWSFPLFRS